MFDRDNNTKKFNDNIITLVLLVINSYFIIINSYFITLKLFYCYIALMVNLQAC